MGKILCFVLMLLLVSCKINQADKNSPDLILIRTDYFTKDNRQVVIKNKNIVNQILIKANKHLIGSGGTTKLKLPLTFL